ncbi:hypothetical protein GNF18_09515 [Ligilactobacillus pobuzihii]|uniref:hypothetical protein n=1 Tax=Ligilactobacillus pobuzihii TaxID=449659 RepID=UPI0019CF8732|nr:hypothetical protein [Ligilactobacillus pobuzihii]MBN7275377.1 hypothetical protein [Ligilactobacillus pobuzihii]
MLQSFVPFLDKERYLTVCFFEFFLNRRPKSTTASFSELQNKLEISSYKLREIISAAQNLCKLIPELKLDPSADKKVTLTGLNTLKQKKIILYEAHHSLRFKIFIHVTLQPKGYSDAKFQQKHGISRATYFRLKSLLLNDISSKVKNNMASSEAYSRYYIYRVIYYFSYLDFIEDDSGKKEVVTGINHITRLLKLSPTNIQHKQHLYFAIVSYWRNKIGYRMSVDDEKYYATLKETPTIKRMNEYLNKFWASSEISAQRMTNFFLTFLLNNKEFDTNMLTALQDYTLVKKLTSEQIVIIHQSLGKNFSQISLRSLTNKLLKINAKMLVPVYLEPSYSRMKDRGFYENSYLSIAQLTKQLLQCRSNLASARPMGENEYTQLYYSYLFTIFSEIPATAFSDQVRIAVDFSQGMEYTDYIKKKLEEMALLNIQIDKFVSPKTDIYLTNNYDPSFKNYQVVWDHPPLTKDIVNLRQLIVKVKNVKHKTITDNLSNEAAD